VQTDFVLFGPAHLALIAAIPVAAFLLTRAAAGDAARARMIRLALGCFLLVNELVWYAFKLSTEGWRFPEGLPLNLCDLSLWLTVAALLTLHRWACEPAWFAGIAGAAMAVLTPELWAPTCSYPTLYFFTAHGGIIAAMLFLVFTHQTRPGPGAMWRGLFVLHAWATLVGAFNAGFHTNYMFLCRKPSTASLLDFLGPWPWYLLAGEAIALVFFLLLALPFRRAAVPK
jgi:hypothetical integral membrane protein (TIGR02206 family)